MSMASLALAGLLAASQAEHPADFGWQMSVQTDSTHGAARLEVPREAYLNARMPGLADLRLFDRNGQLLPYTFLQAEAAPERSRSERTLQMFPLLGGAAPGEISQLEVQMHQHQLLSVRLKNRGADAPPSQRLSGLVLDGSLNGQPVRIDGLRFTLPAERTRRRQPYQATLMVEASDDLKAWDRLGRARLSWMFNDMAMLQATRCILRRSRPATCA